MPPLEAIIGTLRPKKFSGVVIDVRLLDGFTGPGNQCTGYLIVHGDRWDQRLQEKTSSYTGGTYEVTLQGQGPQGEVKTFQHYFSEPPEIGSQQTFRDYR